MEKIFISDANINVDICLNGCGGILFDNRELEKCATGAYKNKLPIRVVIIYIYTSNKYY